MRKLGQVIAIMAMFMGVVFLTAGKADAVGATVLVVDPQGSGLTSGPPGWPQNADNWQHDHDVTITIQYPGVDPMPSRVKLNHQIWTGGPCCTAGHYMCLQQNWGCPNVGKYSDQYSETNVAVSPVPGAMGPWWTFVSDSVAGVGWRWLVLRYNGPHPSHSQFEHLRVNAMDFAGNWMADWNGRIVYVRS